MRTICITLRQPYEAAGGLYGTAVAPGTVRNLEASKAHFAERGINPQYFYGFDATKLGLRTVNPYEVDAPGSGYNMGPKPTGIWLSHRALWAACLLLPDDEFLIIEDDARFEESWAQDFAQARAYLPEDWNFLFLGSCCALGKPTRHVAAAIYEVKWPMCLQSYLVRRCALEKMIDTQDAATCYGPIDCTLMFHTFETLGGVYTRLPSIVSQADTYLPP